ncbi:hypothetical protein [Aeromicrobium stalagmiti]|uniref:hypothetical protein n=1 Tax=Aeromicrobium stalagmiti TaxID=2738988 RepID=UPI001567F0BB|nr:hypothetical protein [Aeromicrobium stalagmiti]NRQ51559.1 hypothetical protein [Aeromicrobium stalagmiti]
MERQEAIKTLVKGGKSADVRKLLHEKADSAHRAYSQITSDADLTEEAKRSRQAAHYMSVIKGVNDELSRMASRVYLTDQDDASTVFGIKGLDGDVASLSISRRDAADRIASCEASAQVLELLRRATRSGDEVLARAAAEWGVEHRDPKVANEFLKTRPQHDAALQRLWDGEAAERGGGMDIAIAVGGIRPGDMFSMSDSQIEALAQPAYS